MYFKYISSKVNSIKNIDINFLYRIHFLWKKEKTSQRLKICMLIVDQYNKIKNFFIKYLPTHNISYIYIKQKHNSKKYIHNCQILS